MNEQRPLSKDASITDLLALERTLLANERTLLAYIRTSLACLAAAASLIQFFESKVYHFTGYTLIPIGILLLVTGFYRYTRCRKTTKAIMHAKK
jgi:putative membrane protein